MVQQFMLFQQVKHMQYVVSCRQQVRWCLVLDQVFSRRLLVLKMQPENVK